MKSTFVWTYMGVMDNVEPSQDQDVTNEVVPGLYLQRCNV